jgi:hypothetical protein
MIMYVKREYAQGLRIKHGNSFDTYHGEVKDGLPNGWGVAREDNGTIYAGEWKDGQKIGQGTMYFNNGDILFAEWEPHPQGLGHPGRVLWLFKNGAVYAGSINRDWQFCGFGTMIYPGGETKDGRWKSGKFICDRDIAMRMG